MKLLYLGTAAAEGIPGVFCSCSICRTAREKKGKDIRTRSQALVDGKILFDFPPDTYAHYIASGFTDFDLPAIRRLFITHSHQDHFYLQDLHLRKPIFTHPPIEILHIYGNQRVEQKLLNLQEKEQVIPYCEFHYAKPFEPIDAEGYRITPFPALHDQQEECLFYAVEHEGKSLLYAHDTGVFPDSVWDYIAKINQRFDLVSLDCTTIMDKDGGNHMGISDDIDVRERLVSIGGADKKTIFVLNHFSHNGRLNHDELCRIAVKEGFTAAYDGMTIEV
ncbi:MAG: hypothetical protein LBD29_03120 [Treponema sp.]|jgi:phosphoribosyl 1,2-cyclic phosphate phosphodiesterase|nr:hypothetical protein [Treponema sp.]